jgi:hypothetical protein
MIEHMISAARRNGKTPAETMDMAAMLGMSLTLEQVNEILAKVE